MHTYYDQWDSWEPQTPLENGFPRLSPIWGNLGKVPVAPLYFPIGPLWLSTG